MTKTNKPSVAARQKKSSGAVSRPVFGRVLVSPFMAVMAVAAFATIATIVISLSHAGTQTVITEYFGTSATNFTEIRGGTWSLQNGMYKLSNPASPADSNVGNANYAIHKTPVQGDFTFSADIHVPATQSTYDDASVIFNWQDANNYMFASFNEATNDYTNGVFSIVNGSQRRLSAFSATTAPGKTHHVVVTRAGNTYTVQSNGATLAVTVDGTHKGGRFGVGSRNNAADFDNVIVSVPTDTAPPTAPTNVVFNSITTNGAVVSWGVSSDNIGVAGYKVYRNGQHVGTTTARSYNITGLQSGTSYTIGVVAYDAAQNASAQTTARLATKQHVVGATKPSADNTGVPEGVRLTVVNGDTVITKSGTYDAMDYRGFVTIKANNVTIKNSRISGGLLAAEKTCSTSMASGGKYALTVAEGYANFVLEDSEVVVTNPHKKLNGIGGSNMTIRRSEVANGVDGVGIWGAGNVTVEASYIHDLFWVAQDPYHNCGPSHNDGVQIHYGANIKLLGNTIDAKPLNYTQGNAAVMVNQNGGKRTSSVSINNNWIDYGTCAVNVSQNGLGAITGLQIVGNRAGRHVGVAAGRQCAFIVDRATKSLAGNVFSGNVWEDGKTPAPEIISGV